MIAEAQRTAPYIDWDCHCVVLGKGDVRRLCPQQIIILRELTKRPNKLVSYERLIEAMYEGTREGGPMDALGVLQVRVCELRDMVPWRIVTVHRIGYYIEDYP